MTPEIFEPLKQLSHSSSGTVNSCPRKYQLKKLSPNFTLNIPGESEVGELENIHQTFGKVVGLGVQTLMSGKTLEHAWHEMDMAWTLDMDTVHKRSGKSLWTALALAENFALVEKPKLDEDWEVFHFNNKPACELSFRILLPFGYIYRGFIDLVLRHRVTKKLRVLELKTTGNTDIHEAEWRNSNQALGYLVVLHSIFPEAVELTVDYRIGRVKQLAWTQFEFPKKLAARVNFIRDLAIQVNYMQLLQTVKDWPMSGNCYSFGRECEYYGICDYPLDKLILPGTIPAKDFIDEVDLVLDLRNIASALTEEVKKL